MGFPGKNTGVGCHTRLQGIFPHPEVELAAPVSSALQAGSSPAEPLGEILHTIVNSHVTWRGDTQMSTSVHF